jgi:hypothetical protein
VVVLVAVEADSVVAVVVVMTVVAAVIATNRSAKLFINALGKPRAFFVERKIDLFSRV